MENTVERKKEGEEGRMEHSGSAGDGAVAPQIQRKRRMAISPCSPQKRSCVSSEVTGKTEKDVLVCKECGKKLKITNNYSCRCGNVYCIKHRFHDQHGCVFDYRAAAIAKLEIQNPKIVSRRVGDI